MTKRRSTRSRGPPQERLDCTRGMTKKGVTPGGVTPFRRFRSARLLAARAPPALYDPTFLSVQTMIGQDISVLQLSA
jgi:hypothetical protein